jgi:hypothetical protein
MGGPPGKSKLPVILGAVGGVVAVVGAGLLLYFFVFNSDDEASSDDYCTLLEDNAQEFAGLTSGTPDPSEMENAVAVVHQIREAAPEEVADEWAALDDPLQNFQQALDDAGSSWEEVDQAKSPDDVPPEVAQAAQQMFTDFGKLNFSAMNQTISDHAKDECNIDLEELEQQSGQ